MRKTPQTQQQAPQQKNKIQNAVITGKSPLYN